MGFLDFLLGAAAALSVLDTRAPESPQNADSADDDEEALYDDGYDDDCVGDGLDGSDDYLGDGLDGDDDYDENDPGW